MRILAIGDIVGENGVRKLKQELPRIKEENKIDFVIVNAENSAGGMGITTKIFEDLLDLNVDCITMGNHTWGKKDIFSFIDHPKLLRPANYSKGVVGKGLGVYECKGKKIAVINLIGRTDMNVLSENPFTVANDLVSKIIGDVDMIFIDFHAEASAEKIAMGIYLDGKVTAVPQASIKRFVTSLPERYRLAEGECILNGCIFETNDENCRVEKINRINMQ